MIVGTVNSEFEAEISVVVLGVYGLRRAFEAVIDTGFNGDLTLPSEEFVELGLPLVGRRRVTLGDGSQQFVDVYEASVEWDGQARSVQIDSAQVQPLIGMELMRGYNLHIEVVEGGAVSLQPF